MKLKVLLFYVVPIMAALLLAAAGFGVLHLVWKQMRVREARRYLLRGYRCSGEGEFENAIPNFTKAIQLSPTNSLAYYARGDAYFRQKEYASAVKDFSEAIKLHPGNSRALEDRGMCYANKGDYDKAVADFTRLIDRQYHVGMNYYRRGFAYDREKRWENAIDDYKEAARLNSTNDACYQSLAYAYLHEKDPTNAVKNFNESLRLNPDNTENLNNLAWFLAVYPDAAFRDGSAAVELANKACRLTDWRKWRCVDTLAAAYAETGDFTDAVKYQKQALRMDGASDKEDLGEQSRLELYQHHQPFRESLKSEKTERPSE
jgi:tetratricopeptide (TPR) repeat protein